MKGVAGFLPSTVRFLENPVESGRVVVVNE